MEDDNFPSLQIRRRCFTKWSNFILAKAHEEINDVWDLHNSAVFIKLLQVLAQRQVVISTHVREPRNRTQNLQMWMRINEFLEKDNVNIGKLGLGDLADGAIVPLLKLLWVLVEHYQIAIHCRHSIMEEKLATKRDVLLQWIQRKIPQCNVTNFTSDWSDGIAICCLVNSVKPDSIPEKLFKDSSNAERNASIGTQMAKELLGIPNILSSDDIIKPELDELSLVTYLSMFYNVETFGTPENGLIQKASIEENLTPSKDRETTIPCKVYGEGLFKAKLNQVAEFILELNGVFPADLVISVECKPLTGKTGGYRPELSVKPIDSNHFAIKYSPKRPGQYTIGVLYRGNHLWGSPFNINVRGSAELNIYRLSGESVSSQGSASLSDTDSGFESITKPDSLPHVVLTNDINKADGPGLRYGEVGCLGVFTVITEANNKGPLSVCVTCPAVSIPVPYVKSRKHDDITIHTVKYTPTEPGNYDIYIKWGDVLIQDCPFKVTISEVNEIEQKSNQDHGDLGGKGKIRLYYSRTTLDRNEQKRKKELESLLLDKGITRKHYYDQPIAIDLVTDLQERKCIFKKAETRKTPLMFVDDMFIGEYDEILRLNERGLLDRILNFEDVTL